MIFFGFFFIDNYRYKKPKKIIHDSYRFSYSLRAGCSYTYSYLFIQLFIQVFIQFFIQPPVGVFIQVFIHKHCLCGAATKLRIVRNLPPPSPMGRDHLKTHYISCLFLFVFVICIAFVCIFFLLFTRFSYC